MRKWFAAALFAFVLLAGCSGAPPLPSGGPGVIGFQPFWQQWQGVGMIAVFIAFLFASLAYMVGSFLSNASLIAWSKSEVLQAAGSALIMAGLVAGFSAVNALGAGIGNDSGLTGLTCTDARIAQVPAAMNDACHIAIAQRYLEIVYENLFEMNKYLLKTASAYLILADLNINFETLSPPWLTWNIAPFPGINMIVEGLSNMFDLLMKTMLIVKMQEMALEYVWRALFPILVVAGVILRSFFFTRRLGGLLIALAVAAYAVVPMLYMLSFNILDRTTAHSYVIIIDPGNLERETGVIGSGGPVGTDCGGLAASISGSLGAKEKCDIASRMASLNRRQGGFLYFIERVFDPSNENNWYYGDDGLIEKVARVLLYATFIPFAVLMGTIAFVKAFSPLMGGDVEIAGITHLI